MIMDEYADIREYIAEAVHNAWMEGRVSEGWRYGEEKNISLKLDPNICPYPYLTESEKEYDRRTAEATIKALLEKGYRIKKEV